VERARIGWGLGPEEPTYKFSHYLRLAPEGVSSRVQATLDATQLAALYVNRGFSQVCTPSPN
jgi:hypothetical protein